MPVIAYSAYKQTSVDDLFH